MGKRALFGDPPPGMGSPQSSGAGRPAVSDRRALYTPAPPESGGRSLTVECSQCGSEENVGVLPLAARLVPSVWLPLRRWSRFMRCPACGRYTWCRVAWRAPSR
jgi:hypothetical protein